MVSLIIPLFNREDFILSTLESITRQSDSNWECIIIDDGSTDNSFNVVLNYIKNDSRFRLYHRPSNYSKGANGARNFGFQQSKGDYINFIDSDDILHPDFVKYKLKAISDSSADVVLSKTIITSLNIEEVIKYEDRTQLTSSLLDDFITLKVSWYIVDPVWKKQFLIDKELFNENLLKEQDRDFHIRMLLKNPKIQILDKYLYYYRTNPKSISSNMSETTALTVLKEGIKRNTLLLGNNISDTTQFFVYRQMIRLYPLVRKSEKIHKIYFEVIYRFFKFRKRYLIMNIKFFIAIISFKVIGKGEKILK
ncbi:glycosyltransferase family 2 protein [Flavobacterium sp. 3-210]